MSYPRARRRWVAPSCALWLVPLCSPVLSPHPARATVTIEDIAPQAPTALILTAADPLVTTPGSRGRAGDIRLDHGTVAFLIGQPAPPSSDRPPAASGALIDVLQLFPSAQHLGLEQLATGLGGLGGLPGRRAVYVKARITRSPELAAAVLDGYDSDDPGIEVRTEYQVGPALQSGEALRIITTLRNVGPRPVSGAFLGDSLRWGTLDRFTPGPGFAPPPPGPLPRSDGPVPFLQGLGPAGTMLYLPGVVLPGGAGLGGEHGRAFTEVRAALPALAPGGSASYSRMLVVTGDPYRALCTGRAPLLGRAALRGTVRDDAGAALRARVVLYRKGGVAVAVAQTGEGGAFRLCAPGPGDYLVRAEAPGRSGEAVGIKLPGAAEIQLTLGRPARLHLTLREVPPGHSTPKPAPGRVTITPLEVRGATAAMVLGPDVLSTQAPSAPAPGGALSVLAGAGEVEASVPAGRYRVVAGRGPFYDLISEDITLRPGESRKLALVLRRAVPASEVQASRCTLLRALPPDDLLSLARADGLDAVLSTGPQRPGEPALIGAGEIGARLGRFTLFPLPPGTALPDLRRAARAADLLASLRRVPGEGGPPLIQGAVPVDAGSPGPDAAAAWDAREIWTGPGTGGVPAQLAAWLAVVDRGLAVAGVAGIDPRADVLAQGPVMPRTCAGRVQINQALGPGEATRLALRRGDAVVTNGPWLRVAANGAGIGELAAAPDGKVEVTVTAYAAAHVDLREIEIFAGPRSAARIPVPAGSAPLRYRGITRLSVERDAAIVVVARGGRPLDPAAPGALPLAFTNPVLVDRDGDGHFAAPPGSKKK